MFSASYEATRFRWAETPIGGYVYYCGVLEGIQSDQDFLRVLFNLERTAARQLCCFYCDALQWVSLKAPTSHLNNVESLYSVYGPRESDTKLVSVTEWIALHGLTPLCTIVGWDPSRTLIYCGKVLFFQVKRKHLANFSLFLTSSIFEIGKDCFRTTCTLSTWLARLIAYAASF